MEREPRHPGLTIAAEYLVPLGLEPGEFASACGLDPEAFGRMLTGEQSFDVKSASRVARALELDVERIVQMQVKYDLYVAKHDAELARIGLLSAPRDAAPFPDEALRGTLAETSDIAYDGYCWFFREDVAGARGYDGLHALWRGDVLRVYEPDGRVLYTGTLLRDLGGRMLLPFVAFKTWSRWFFERYPAALALGEEHRAFLDNLAANEA